MGGRDVWFQPAAVRRGTDGRRPRTDDVQGRADRWEIGQGALLMSPPSALASFGS